MEKNENKKKKKRTKKEKRKGKKKKRKGRSVYWGWRVTMAAGRVIDNGVGWRGKEGGEGEGKR